jgi:hypothetical protein
MSSAGILFQRHREIRSGLGEVGTGGLVSALDSKSMLEMITWIRYIMQTPDGNHTSDKVSMRFPNTHGPWRIQLRGIHQRLAHSISARRVHHQPIPLLNWNNTTHVHHQADIQQSHHSFCIHSNTKCFHRPCQSKPYTS